MVENKRRTIAAIPKQVTVWIVFFVGVIALLAISIKLAGAAAFFEQSAYRFFNNADSSTAFDTDGICDSGNSCFAAATNTPRGITRDATYLYIVGKDDSSNTRFEKRLLSTGALDTNFGTSGVVTSTGGDANDVAVDSTYMYIVGNTSGTDWRIEKRLLSNGNACSAANCGTEFGTNGSVTTDAQTNVAYSVVIDSTYMYIAGDDSLGNWRIEKRLLTTGALDTNFDTDGIADGITASVTARGIKIDSTYMYIVGSNDSNTNDWRIEKRLLSSGALCSAANCGTEFGTNGAISGASTSNVAYSMGIDSTYMYVVGDDAGSANVRIEKRLLTTGALDTNFDTDGIVDAASSSDIFRGVAIDSTYLYAVGKDNTAGKFRIEKRLLTTGALDTNFDTDGIIDGDVATDSSRDVVIDSSALYLVGNDDSVNWRIEKRLLTSGALVAGSADLGASLASQDTAATLSSTGDAFRLRALLHVSTQQADASANTFKLQFAARSGTCDTGFSGETYADVTSGTTISYKNNTNLADASAIVYNASDPTHSSDTVVYQTYEEANNFTNSYAAIPTGQDGLWDFALYDNGATASGTYCFRIVKSDNTPLDTYTVIPQITMAAGAGITVSGNLRQSDGSTAIDCSTGGNRTVRVKVNGAGSYSGDCTLSSGAYSVSGITAASGDVLTIYLDGETEDGVVVTRALDDTSSISAPLYQNHVIVRHEDSGPITNTNLDQYDTGNDADIPFTVTGGNLTLSDSTKLLVWTGKTFTPGGTVTTSVSSDGTDTNVDGDVNIQASSTLSMGTNALSIGGDFANSGTFSKSSGQTTTFTATATGHTIDMGTGNFENVTLNGASGGWSFSDASNTIDSDLTVTAGTLSGTTNLTASGDVTGAGTITLTSGTFTHSTTTSKSFGGSGTWTFDNITFSGASGTSATAGAGGVTVTEVLTIGSGHTLNAGSKTWTLSGSGTPLVATGTFTAGTSTFVFSGAGAAQDEGDFTLYQANIQSGTGTDGVQNYSRQVDALASTGVDIVTVNEQWVSDVAAVDTLLAAKGFSRAFYVGNNVGGDPSATQDGQAIWYRNTTVTLNNYYTHALSTNMVGFGGTHVDKSAGAVDITVGGKRFYVVSAHLCWSACADSGGSTYSAQRVTQINELLSWINSTLTGGYDIIISGDLNFGPDYPVSPSGTQLGLFTTNYSDLWQEGIADGKATAPWGDRNSDAVQDMPVTNLTTRTHDTRRIDYVLLNNSATSLALNAITVPDLRETCPHGLVAGGTLPSCEPEVTGGPTTSGQQWDIEDDFGVRPSDHNFVKTTFDLMSVAGGPVTIPALTYYNMTLNSSGNTFVAASGTLGVGGALNITAGTLDLNTNDPATTISGVTTIGGTLSASASASLTFADNFINNGTFTHNNGTVTLSPSSSSIDVKGTSNTTFYNFTMNGSDKTLQFKNGNTYTFAGTLTLAGTSGHPLLLHSTTNASQWDMTLSGSAAVTYATVQDSGCVGGNNVSDDGSLIDAGNNDSCWVFVIPDVTAPVRSLGLPATALSAGTTGATLSLTTDETATCKYDTSSGVAYGSMANTFTSTGSTSHSSTLSGLTNGTSYNYYVRCQDTQGNANSTDYTISFSVSSAASSGGSGGGAAAPVTPITPTPTPSLTIGGIISPLDPLRLVNENGTYYVISNNQRYGVTNPGLLASFGLEFKDAQPSTPSDNALPYVDNLKPGEGSLVKEIQNKTVWLISQGKRHGFTSLSVFSGLGFSLGHVLNVLAGELLALAEGFPLAETTSAHQPGVYILQDKTVYRINEKGEKQGVPSIEVWNSLNIDNDFSRVVPANDADRLLPEGPVLTSRLIN